MDEMADTNGVVLHSGDLALFSGHPVGLSQRRAQGRMGTALWEVFPGHVALLDRDGVVISVNRAWRRFGLANGAGPPTGLGSNYLDVCVEVGSEASEAAEIVRLALAGEESDRRLRYLCGDRWFSMQAFPLPGLHAGALVVHMDITAEADDLRRWRHQALHDPLTGLPNRALLEDRLAHAVAGAVREPGSVAVLFIDLDGFKQINDVHGHAAGDQVLKEVADRLAGVVRSGDTVGRWGGDEYLVVAERLEHSGSAAELADRIIASLD
jgi:GGDEF domain-containing protein